MDSDTRINEAFERYYKVLFNFCLTKLEGDEQAAMDAIDTVFMIAKSKADGLDGIKDIKQWLFSTARNTVMNIRRVQGRYHRRFIPFDPGSFNTDNYGDGTKIQWWLHKVFSSWSTQEMEFCDQELTDEEIAELKNKFLQTLNGEERELFCSRYDDGVSTKELAERYGKTQDAIRIRLSRISMKLTERIKIYFENERSF
ncbi:MAG: sigma-70 family RNA polymerase sigma factor [Lachnospiraceae bacterium]|nr:sigma-70 family RNA polymerase sigma factor [Lachnospiraceae bacterium]